MKLHTQVRCRVQCQAYHGQCVYGEPDAWVKTADGEIFEVTAKAEAEAKAKECSANEPGAIFTVINRQGCMTPEATAKMSIKLFDLSKL